MLLDGIPLLNFQETVSELAPLATILTSERGRVPLESILGAAKREGVAQLDEEQVVLEVSCTSPAAFCSESLSGLIPIFLSSGLGTPQVGGAYQGEESSSCPRTRAR